MKKILLITAALGLFVVTSCKKSTNDSATPTVSGTTINDIKVPAGFDWASSRSLNFSVSSTDSRFGSAIQTITVYDADPNNGGKLLSQGSVSLATAFTTKLYVSNITTSLYVVKTAPDKSTLTQIVTAGKADISLTMGAIDASLKVSSINTNKQVLATAPTSPDCNSGCTVTVTANANNVNLNSGDVMCITASNTTVNFSNVNGGTIRVCGQNVTLQNLSFNGAATLIVTANGSANISSINFNSSAASIVNFGTINFSNSFPLNGIFSNYGVFNCSGDFNLNSNAGVFTNNGTITIGGSFNDGTTAVATNNGAMTVGGNFQPNSNSNFVNNCSLTVGGNYTQNSGVSLKNYGFIKVGGVLTVNSNTELSMYNTAMVKTAGLIVDGTIKGYGSTSLLEITGNTVNIENQGSVVSNIQVYSFSTINSTSQSKITSGATIGNSVYVPISGCNSDGNGSPAVVDSDGDGVADNLDAYPNDATKAYNVTGAFGTIGFEDQWPAKGDFDMNDLVMGYSYTLVTNAKNMVVQVSGSYTLFATGGSLPNAFGIEFPVASSLASGLNVTKAGTSASTTFESGQANATVILFSNMRNEMATWNTKTTEVFTAYKNYSLTFNITSGIALSTFGQDFYNPFLYNNGRGHEVHIYGKKPTSLADASYFGTQDDASNPASGIYYVTKTGLPYAINIPAATFSYPLEGMDITKAYLHFSDWAVSNGTSYVDWYSNTGTGYRNVTNIFTH